MQAFSRRCQLEIPGTVQLALKCTGSFDFVASSLREKATSLRMTLCVCVDQFTLRFSGVLPALEIAERQFESAEVGVVVLIEGEGDI